MYQLLIKILVKSTISEQIDLLQTMLVNLVKRDLEKEQEIENKHSKTTIFDEELVKLINNLSSSIKDFMKIAKFNIKENDSNTQKLNENILQLKTYYISETTSLNSLTSTNTSKSPLRVSSSGTNLMTNNKNSYNNSSNNNNNKLQNLSLKFKQIEQTKADIQKSVNNIDNSCNMFYDNAKLVFKKLKVLHSKSLTELSNLNNEFNNQNLSSYSKSLDLFSNKLNNSKNTRNQKVINNNFFNLSEINNTNNNNNNNFAENFQNKTFNNNFNYSASHFNPLIRSNSTNKAQISNTKSTKLNNLMHFDESGKTRNKSLNPLNFKNKNSNSINSGLNNSSSLNFNNTIGFNTNLAINNEKILQANLDKIKIRNRELLIEVKKLNDLYISTKKENIHLRQQIDKLSKFNNDLNNRNSSKSPKRNIANLKETKLDKPLNKMKDNSNIINNNITNDNKLFKLAEAILNFFEKMNNLQLAISKKAANITELKYDFEQAKKEIKSLANKIYKNPVLIRKESESIKSENSLNAKNLITNLKVVNNNNNNKDNNEKEKDSSNNSNNNNKNEDDSVNSSLMPKQDIIAPVKTKLLKAAPRKQITNNKEEKEENTVKSDEKESLNDNDKNKEKEEKEARKDNLDLICNQLKEEIESLNRKLQEKESLIETFEENFNKRSTLESTLKTNEEIKALNLKNENLKKEKILFEESIINLKEENKRLSLQVNLSKDNDNTNNNLKEEKEIFNKEIKSLKEEIVYLKEESKVKENESLLKDNLLKEIKLKLEELEKLNLKFNLEVKSLKTLNYNLEALLKESENKFFDLNKENNELLLNKESLNLELKDLKQNNKNLLLEKQNKESSNLLEFKQQIKEYKEELKEKNLKFENLNLEFKRLKTENENLNLNLSNYLKDLNIEKSKNKELNLNFEESLNNENKKSFKEIKDLKESLQEKYKIDLEKMLKELIQENAKKEKNLEKSVKSVYFDFLENVIELNLKKIKEFQNLNFKEFIINLEDKDLNLSLLKEKINNLTLINLTKTEKQNSEFLKLKEENLNLKDSKEKSENDFNFKESNLKTAITNSNKLNEDLNRKIKVLNEEVIDVNKKLKSSLNETNNLEIKLKNKAEELEIFKNQSFNLKLDFDNKSKEELSNFSLQIFNLESEVKLLKNQIKQNEQEILTLQNQLKQETNEKEEDKIILQALELNYSNIVSKLEEMYEKFENIAKKKNLSLYNINNSKKYNPNQTLGNFEEYNQFNESPEHLFEEFVENLENFVLKTCDFSKEKSVFENTILEISKKNKKSEEIIETLKEEYKNLKLTFEECTKIIMEAIKSTDSNLFDEDISFNNIQDSSFNSKASSMSHINMYTDRDFVKKLVENFKKYNFEINATNKKLESDLEEAYIQIRSLKISIEEYKQALDKTINNTKTNSYNNNNKYNPNIVDPESIGNNDNKSIHSRNFTVEDLIDDNLQIEENYNDNDDEIDLNLKIAKEIGNNSYVTLSDENNKIIAHKRINNLCWVLVTNTDKVSSLTSYSNLTWFTKEQISDNLINSYNFSESIEENFESLNNNVNLATQKQKEIDKLLKIHEELNKKLIEKDTEIADLLNTCNNLLEFNNKKMKKEADEDGDGDVSNEITKNESISFEKYQQIVDLYNEEQSKYNKMLVNVDTLKRENDKLNSKLAFISNNNNNNNASAKANLHKSYTFNKQPNKDFDEIDVDGLLAAHNQSDIESQNNKFPLKKKRNNKYLKILKKRVDMLLTMKVF